MKNFVLVMALTTFALLTGGACEATTISTTKADVKKQCGNSVGCSTACGSTTCDYGCKGSKCTVTINLKIHRGTGTGTGTGTGIER